MNQKHHFFGSDKLAGSLATEDVDARIVSAVQYMTTRLTSKQVDDQTLARIASRELSRKIASRTLDYLDAKGIAIRDACLMDLGAGLGMVSEEVALRGGNPVAVEPGSGFREITFERIRRSGRGTVIAAIGENLPFRDNSFDVVISLQVLEHVEQPAAVLCEIYRILKPGGWFYLTCPNYLSFHEGHYNVAWLPLLPKRLGSLYLRLRGRPTEFLNTSVTYTTLPWVRRTLKRCGFVSERERNIYDRCRSPDSIKSRRKQRLVRAARRVVSTKLVWHEQLSQLFNRNFSELVQKPSVLAGERAQLMRTKSEARTEEIRSRNTLVRGSMHG
jgi:SAM-dependent methyltransferase